MGRFTTLGRLPWAVSLPLCPHQQWTVQQHSADDDAQGSVCATLRDTFHALRAAAAGIEGLGSDEILLDAETPMREGGASVANQRQHARPKYTSLRGVTTSRRVVRPSTIYTAKAPCTAASYLI